MKYEYKKPKIQDQAIIYPKYIKQSGELYNHEELIACVDCINEMLDQLESASKGTKDIV